MRWLALVVLVACGQHRAGVPGVARKLDDGVASATEWAHDSAVDSAGAVYVAGQYFGTPSFGAGAMTYAPEGGPLLLKLAP